MIIDNNFLHPEECNSILDTITGNYFPWFIIDDHVHEKDKLMNKEKIVSLSHNLYNNGEISSQFYPNMLEIFDKFCFKHKIQKRAILRARLNYSFQNNGLIGEPHVDWPFDHNVFICYLNESDGDTIIYNQKHEEFNLEKINIKKRISPSLGKAISFDGSYLHSASNPKNYSSRIIFNLSFL